MEKGLHDLPIFLYVKAFSYNKRRFYEGDLCWGRKPTMSENIKFINAGILFSGVHFIQGVKNLMHDVYISKTKSPYVFSNLEELIYRAKELYTQNSYTTGLILSGDKKSYQIPERVIIIDEKYLGTEECFLKHANENVIWNN
ncbi:MAG: hypothetical protein M0P26_06730 [Bacteroidales bacterium]|nr:hypothetical protein [Bacteroidales bacterium]